MKQPRVYIITGGKDSGKTTLLCDVVKLLQEHELETRGFVSELDTDDHGGREYYLTNINTGNQQLLCTYKNYPGWIFTGKFYFNPVIIEMGTEILTDKTPPLPDFFIMDEIGKLETQGMIWEAVVKTLLDTENAKLIWTCRDEWLTEVVKYFKLLNYRIFEASEMSAQEIVKSILSK